MAKSPDLQIVTANRLRDGAVVYLRPDGHWSTRVGEAVSAADDEQARGLLAIAARAAAQAQVVAPYAIAVERQPDGSLRPTGYRERIRAEGPSIALISATPPVEPRHVSV